MARPLRRRGHKQGSTRQEREAQAEIERRGEEIAELTTKLSSYTILTPQQQQALEAYADTVALGIDHATFEDKCQYLDWLKVECHYNQETGEIVVNGIFKPIVCIMEDISKHEQL